MFFIRLISKSKIKISLYSSILLSSLIIRLLNYNNYNHSPRSSTHIAPPLISPFSPPLTSPPRSLPPLISSPRSHRPLAYIAPPPYIAPPLISPPRLYRPFPPLAHIAPPLISSLPFPRLYRPPPLTSFLLFPLLYYPLAYIALSLSSLISLSRSLRLYRSSLLSAYIVLLFSRFISSLAFLAYIYIFSLILLYRLGRDTLSTKTSRSPIHVFARYDSSHV